MNATNQKTISISIFNFVLPLFVLLFVQVAANAQSYTPEEQNCYSMVQGKVAWNTAGTTSWGEANVRNLCKGTTNAAQTVNCFSSKISAGVDWSVATPACAPTALKSTSTKLEGTWTMYNDKGIKFDKLARIVQSGANLSINNGYGANSTGVLNGNTLTTSDGLTGTVSADGTRINWNIGFVWVRTGSTANNLPNYVESETQLTPAPLKDATNKGSTDSGTITRTITIKNKSVMSIFGYLINRELYVDPRNQNGLKIYSAKVSNLINGQTATFGENVSYQINDEVEFFMRDETIQQPFFKATLPKNKDLTTFCYELTGTYFVPSVKACDGGATYESKHISFKNEAGYNSIMSLTYYPTGGSSTKTATTLSTTPGYQTKLYLPLDADTDKQMTLKISKEGFSTPVLSREVSLSDFDITCYKVWGSFVTAKVSPCSLNPSARKVKLWNNSGYPASLSVTYYDKDNAGKDVARTVKTNPIEVTQTDTIEVPNGTSPTPVKINFINHWKNGIPFSTMTATADFTGELCYKVEGTTFAPTAATCDDTVGDTSGETRQIRFQNDAGFDAAMIVNYFVDEVINGQKMVMPKTLTTGMINGLGGKFRLASIPKNTSVGMPITISLQGSTTVKNDIFSTTLPADFAASPQPCFKVTGTLFDPQGGKCNR